MICGDFLNACVHGLVCLWELLLSAHMLQGFRRHPCHTSLSLWSSHLARNPMTLHLHTHTQMVSKPTNRTKHGNCDVQPPTIPMGENIFWGKTQVKIHNVLLTFQKWDIYRNGSTKQWTLNICAILHSVTLQEIMLLMTPRKINDTLNQVTWPEAAMVYHDKLISSINRVHKCSNGIWNNTTDLTCNVSIWQIIKPKQRHVLPCQAQFLTSSC